jgi:alpha-amylase
MSRIRPLYAGAASLLLTAALLTAVAVNSPSLKEVKADANPGARDVIVHLFEWPWASIASECTSVLGPKGFGAVQVSPPQEHVVLPGQGYPWWQDYQPVSYQIVSRRGNRAAFASMVQTCHAAGVKIYVDAVVNHMAGGASTGAGSNGSTYSHYSYPAVPYGNDDFHHCGRNGNDDIANWTDRWEVQNCELVDLSDLKTESSYVRGKLTAYMNDLISLGVDGFRIDAAKHTPVADLQAVLSGLNGAPYIFTEVIEGGPGEISPSEYAGISDVTEFRYGDKVGNAFRDANMSGLNDFGGMLLSSGDAVNFIDNHDTQRNGRARLTYKDGQTHALAQAFSLAYPYGVPQLMSSFSFTNPEAGPPAASNGTTNAVSCGSGWECEHRRTIVANMVGFHNRVNGTNVNNWTSPQSSRISFGRGNAGHVAFNRSSTAWTGTFSTQLPNGSYCNVAATGCQTITVSGGQFSATVPANGMIALQNGTTGSPSPTPTGGCTATAVTFNLNESAFIVGSIPALGNWNTAAAIPVPGTVSIPFNTSFQYKYIRKDAAGNVTWEYDPNRSRSTTTACTATYNETWNGPGGGGSCTSIAVTFEVNATTFFGQNVFVTGSIAALSSWNTGSAIALSSAAYPIWRGTVNIAPSTSFEYKFIKKDGSNVTWESGTNRSYSTPSSPCAVTVSSTWK